MRSPIAATVILLAAPGGVAAPCAGQPGTLYKAAAATPHNRVDELVFASLKALNLSPAGVCSDAVFLRHAYLEVIGTVPAVDEARAFLEDRDANTRAALDLLPRYVDERQSPLQYEGPGGEDPEPTGFTEIAIGFFGPRGRQLHEVLQ